MRKLHEYNFVLNLTRADTNGDEVADQKDEKTPVKWQILSEEDTDGDGEVDDLFLLADQVLDAKAYNDKGVEKTDSDGNTYTDYSCTWETSTVRTWLNGDFYNELFSLDEKKELIKFAVSIGKGKDNPFVKLLFPVIKKLPKSSLIIALLNLTVSFTCFTASATSSADIFSYNS